MKPMNRVVVRLGVCAIASVAGSSASAQWTFGSFANDTQAVMSKRVEITSPESWVNNFQWNYKTRMDTRAVGDGKTHDPLEYKEEDEGNWTTGGPLNHVEEAKINGSSALVSSCFAVEGSVASGKVVGELGVAGKGVLGKPKAEAEGSAASELKLRWTKEDASGKVRHAGKWVTAADAGSFSSKTRKFRYTDPIDLRIFDRTRNAVLIDARIWETDCWITDGVAIMDRGTFSTSGLGSGAVFITAGHELLGGVGHIVLTWENGVITSSFDDGMFDGVLPALGMSSLGPLFHIGDADGYFEYDVNLGAGTTAGYEWTLGLASSGEGSAELVPAPGAAALALVGVGMLALRRQRG